MDQAPARTAQASSFGTAAVEYARGRPPYPPQAVDWLLPDPVGRVLDLGAGTGKLTAALVARGMDVVAVEPSEGMRAQLHAYLPEVLALAGSAEAIPLPDRSVHAVLVAQAWHWVDPSRAGPEVARVLADGGRLGLVWNVRDEAAAWVAALNALLRQVGDDPAGSISDYATNPDLSVWFGPVEVQETAWTHRLPRRAVIDMVASRSYVITAEPRRRERLLSEVDELLNTHPDLVSGEDIDLPYRTYAYRLTKL